MKKIILVPMVTTIFMLSACEEAQQIQQVTQQAAQISNEINQSIQDVNQEIQQGSNVLQAANMLYIVADITQMQNQANEHINQLQETKHLLEQAVDQQNSQQLALGIDQLNQQINSLNQILQGLDLKSQEVDEIRHNIMATNQMILDSALLKGQLNIKNIDFSAFEKQMGNVENEMLKLATMMSYNEKSDS